MRLIGLAVVLAVGLLFATLTAEVQPAAKIPKIGILNVGTAAATQHFFEAFKQGMRERGYVEGQHVVFERRTGENRRERNSPSRCARYCRLVTQTPRP